jgi:hypothetical protein
MRMRQLLASLAILLTSSVPLAAQSNTPQPKRRTALYTVLGALGGFGVGAFVGYRLNVFEDTPSGEEKAVTTVVVSTVIGGIVGHMLAPRGSSSPTRISQRRVDAILTDAEVDRLARTMWLGREPPAVINRDGTGEPTQPVPPAEPAPERVFQAGDGNPF